MHTSTSLLAAQWLCHPIPPGFENIPPFTHERQRCHIFIMMVVYYSFDLPNLKIASVGEQATQGRPGAFIV